MTKNLKGSLILLLTAIIWGTSFVSQKLGMNSVGPFTFMGLRTLLGAVVLLPFIFVTDAKKTKNERMSFKNKNLLQMLIIKSNYRLGYGDVCISPERFKADKENFLNEFTKRRAIDQ